MLALQKSEGGIREWQLPKTCVLRFPSPSTSESAKNGNGWARPPAAFQIPEELFQRIKRHLERETLRTGKKLTQRDFVLNLITQALDEAEAESAAEQDFPAEAPAEARVDDEATPADTDTPDEESAV